MRMKASFACAAVMLSVAGGVLACEGAGPMVAVHYAVSEQVPERVEASITNPVEKLLANIPRLVELNSNTSHGAVDFELRFEGGATERDLANVKARLDGWRADREAGVISSRVALTTECLNKWPWNGDAKLSALASDGAAYRPG